MDNLSLGITTFSIATITYWLAWRFRKKNVNYAVLAIILGGLILRIFVASDGYLHEWDERYHALVAKHLTENPLVPTLYKNPVLPYDYTNWAANHIWVHKQPLPLWTMALSLKLFGTSEFAVRLPSILLSTLAIWLTFLIARFFFSQRVALLAAFLHAIHGLTIELTGGRVATDHIDLFFLFWIELGVYFAIVFCQKPRWWLSLGTGICIGAAILCKWLPALIVLPIFFLLAKDKCLKNGFLFFQLGLVALGAFLTAAPWQWYILQTFPAEANWEYSFNAQHIFEVLQGHDHPWYFHFSKMLQHYGYLVFIPLIWFSYWSIKSFFQGNWKYLAISVWFWVPYLFFTIVKTKMQAYTLFAAPTLFLMTAWALNELNKIKVASSWKNYFFYGSAVLLLGLPIRTTIERTKVFWTRERNPAIVEDYKALNEQFSNPEKTILLNVAQPIEAMFYANVIAYERASISLGTIDSLSNLGYKIYYCESSERLACKVIR